MGGMKTLAFDTCFGACSVAVTWSTPDGGGQASRFERMLRGHAERLMPMVRAAMADAPFAISEIERIVVTTGPGTFTGQRVGISAARAFSLATGAPVGTFSSLAVMAFTAGYDLGADREGKDLAVAVDARRGEIYFQAFSGPGLVPLDEPALLTPDVAAERLGGRGAIVVGSGASLVSLAAEGLGISLAARLPELEADVRFIPEAAIVVGETPPRPLYLRPPDAKIPAAMALARGP